MAFHAKTRKKYWYLTKSRVHLFLAILSLWAFINCFLYDFVRWEAFTEYQIQVLKLYTGLRWNQKFSADTLKHLLEFVPISWVMFLIHCYHEGETPLTVYTFCLSSWGVSLPSVRLCGRAGHPEAVFRLHVSTNIAQRIISGLSYFYCFRTKSWSAFQNLASVKVEAADTYFWWTSLVSLFSLVLRFTTEFLVLLACQLTIPNIN